MKTKVKQYANLPFEVGKIYKTRFATGESFLLQKIVKDKSQTKTLWYEGLYIGEEHVGICPLGLDRLIPVQIEIGEVEVCSLCGSILEPDYSGDYIVV